MIDEILVFALMFALMIFPMLARSWRSLIWIVALTSLPAVLSGVVMIAVPGAGVAFLAFVGFGVPVILGSLARALSLFAASRGHERPNSLWIEAAFLILGAVFVFGAMG